MRAGWRLCKSAKRLPKDWWDDQSPHFARWPKAKRCHAASHEGALHLDDILTRRTRISIETPDRGIQASEEVAALVAPVLGWDDDTKKCEVTHYRARVEAELQSQQEPDDHTADAARLDAPDVRGATPPKMPGLA